MARDFPQFPPGPLTWESAAVLNDMARELGRLTSGSFHSAGLLGVSDDACGITYSLDPSGIWTGAVFLVGGEGTTVSGNQNDFALGGGPWQRIEPSGATRTITGFTSTQQTDGRLFVITNTSTSEYLTLSHNSSSSTAGNRILTSTRNDFVLWPGMSVLVQYDSAATAWRIVAKSCDGGGPQYFSQSSTTVTSNQTDLSLTTLPGPMLSLEPDADRSIFSIDPGTGLDDGRVLIITNTSSDYDLTIAHEYTTGTTAAMRISTATGHDQVISPGDSLLLIYDTTLSRWRTVGQTASDPAVTFIEAQTFAAQTDNLTLTRTGDTLLRVTLTGDQTLTGITAMEEGTVVWVANVDGGTDTLTIADSSGSSSSANQFDNGLLGSIALAPDTSAGYIYDGTTNKWRLIATTARPPVTSLPTTPGTSTYTGAVLPVWVKITKSHTDFQTAATTNNITLYSLPAGGVVHAVKVKHSVQFTGGGGMSSYTITGVGITGSLTKYYGGNLNVFAAPAATGGHIWHSAAGSAVTIEDHGTATDLKVAVASNVDLSNSSAGSVDIWLLVSIAT